MPGGAAFGLDPAQRRGAAAEKAFEQAVDLRPAQFGRPFRCQRAEDPDDDTPLDFQRRLLLFGFLSKPAGAPGIGW